MDFTGSEFLTFHLIRKLESITRKITLIKIRQFAKFVILPLDCDHVEGFQKSET